VAQAIESIVWVIVWSDVYSGLVPQYLVEDCELVAAADRHQLRSSYIATFVIPRIYTRLGDRAFPVAGPRLWTAFHPTYDSLTLPFCSSAGR